MPVGSWLEREGVKVALIGNMRDARKALRGELDYIGEGCSRKVYVDKDEKYVYKVGLMDSGADDNCNVGEHLMFSVLRVASRWSKHIPKSRLIYIDGRPVLCMPYFANHARGNPAIGKVANGLFEDKVLCDVADFNFRADDNDNLFVIDGGEAGWSGDPERMIEILQFGKATHWAIDEES